MNIATNSKQDVLHISSIAITNTSNNIDLAIGLAVFGISFEQV
ncbi:MAG TPA: hypothetical protein VF338_00725 [Leptolinea sp.]